MKTMKNLILKLIELLPFFSVVAILGFIAYTQFNQLKRLEIIDLKLEQQKVLLTAKYDLQTQNSIKALLQQKKLNSTAIEELKNSLLTITNHIDELKLSSNITATQKKDPLLSINQSEQIGNNKTTPKQNKTPPKQNKTTPKQNKTTPKQNKIPSKQIMTQKTNIDTVKPNNEALDNKINEQLATCKQHLDNNQLTRGNNGNAYSCYQGVLKQQPGNKRAKHGIFSIEQRYESYVIKYIKVNNYSKAQRFLTSLMQINPQNKNIKSLQLQLNKAMEPNTSLNNSSLPNTSQNKKPSSTLGENKKEINPEVSIADNKIKTHWEDNFVHINSGCFKKSSKDTCITHDFFIGKYEVTQKQWQDIMKNNPSRFNNCGNNCPVENISWLDIQEFIRKINKQSDKHYRLPSSDEWEYATRAGSHSEFYFGDDVNKLSRYANYCDQLCDNDWKDSKQNDAAKNTIAVGQYKPNAWGLYDTLGNVWEWVEIKNAEKQPYRGGSWGDSNKLCTSSSTGEAKPDFSVSGIGFRLAHDM